MATNDISRFKEIWFVDFEFSAPDGEKPTPVCLVAREMKSCRTLRVGQDDLLKMKAPPYAIGADALIVAYYSSAEFGCHLALGWDLPENVLDLFTEFRNRTNGLEVPCGSGILGALAYFGLDAIESTEKEAMRELAIRGGPFTSNEMNALLDYCETDAVALARLLPKLMPDITLEHALLRGEYMKAAATIERNGIPLDVDATNELREYWPLIQERLIQKIDANFGVFEGKTFKTDRFIAYLQEHEIPWPLLPSGAPALDEDTFKEMSRAFPQIAPIRELRDSLGKMRLSTLTIGSDRRNRCLLSAFQAKTGRNQPSNSKFIYGPSCWLRGLIRPAEGFGLAYIDWSQQEFGIAAALSGDEKMMAAYKSGDPYLAFAKQAGAVPPEATKSSHKEVRNQFKACVLAVQYGMGEFSLATRIGQSVAQARELLRLHRLTYPVFWRWSDAAVDHAMMYGSISTVYGWTHHMDWKLNPKKRRFEAPNQRSIRNFPMQANGAEMLRLACIFAIERSVKICAPVHDAILIEAPLDGLDQAIATMQAAMRDASRIILNGFELGTDAKVVTYPERYEDERGIVMWSHVWELISELKAQRT